MPYFTSHDAAVTALALALTALEQQRERLSHLDTIDLPFEDCPRQRDLLQRLEKRVDIMTELLLKEAETA